MDGKTKLHKNRYNLHNSYPSTVSLRFIMSTVATFHTFPNIMTFIIDKGISFRPVINFLTITNVYLYVIESKSPNYKKSRFYQFRFYQLEHRFDCCVTSTGLCQTLQACHQTIMELNPILISSQAIYYSLNLHLNFHTDPKLDIRRHQSDHFTDRELRNCILGMVSLKIEYSTGIGF